MSVQPGGPGAAADIRQGDVIVAWDGEPISSVHALLRSLGPVSVGKIVSVGLKRAGEPFDVKLRIGERPAS
jgi:S1-C subfamily serine protease